MKKFTSILLTGLLTVLSLTSMTASAATGDTTSDDVANIYVTDSYIDETDVPSPDSPAFTAHVGDIVEVQVSCIATSDIKDFTTYDVRTYINQPSATERNRKITGNESLLFKENGYGDGTFFTLCEDLSRASVVTNPHEDSKFPINHNDFIYTCSNARNIGDFSEYVQLYTFTLEVVKPGNNYINTIIQEIARIYEDKGLAADNYLLKSNTTVSILKKAEKPTEPEPTTVEPQPTTEITEPVTQPTTMTEPVTEPTVTEPIESIPTVPDTEPTTSEPVTEPIETEPIETEPTYTEPVETDPVKTDPVPTTEPVETEPTTEEIPTEVVPTNPEPTSEPLTEPTTSEPVTEPTETEPVTSAPATEPVTTVNPTETVVPDTTKPTGANTEPTKVQDATSTTGTPATPDTATKPSVNNTANTNNVSGKTGFVTTGQALPVAYFALTAISAGVYLLTRKRKSKINK